MKAFATLRGKIVALAAAEDALFVVYERPWWQFWRPAYGVRRFQGEEIV